MCRCFGNYCVGVLVTCVLVFTVFCSVCTVFLHCFIYVYFIFVLFVLVKGLLPLGENPIVVNNNNNNNSSSCCCKKCFLHLAKILWETVTTSQLVTLLEVIAAPIQGSNILGLTVTFKFISQIFLLNFLNYLLASHLTLLILSTLLLFRFCNPCTLACIL
jgi:hypothetical protein